MKNVRSAFAVVTWIVAATACGGSIGDGSGGSGGGTPSTSHGPTGTGGGGGPVACKMGETHSCYTGPSGTLDVGICKAGVQDCTEQGVFGACHGQVLPREENCDKRGDEDCNGNGCSDAIWDRAAGGSGTQQMQAIAIDGEGSTYVAGYYKGAVDFGKGDVPSTGDFDLVVVKFDSAGKLKWQTNIPTTGSSAPSTPGIAVSSTGDVAIGVFSNGQAVIFPQMAFPPSNNNYVAVFDKDGKGKWANPIHASIGLEINGIGYDKSDHLIATGHFSGTITCSTNPCPTSLDSSDIYLRSFDDQGADLWTKSYGGANAENVRGFSITDSNIFVVGDFLTSTKLAGKTFTSKGERDVYVLRTKLNGDADLAVAFGGDSSDIGYTVAGNPDGSFVVGGQTVGVITIGDVSTGDGTTGAYVFAFDASGKADWARGFGKTGTSYVYSLSSDFDGNVWAVGTITNGKATFGRLVTAGDAPVTALMNLDGGGNFRWSKAFDGPGGVYDGRVAVNRDRVSAFSATYTQSVDVGLGPHTVKATYESLVATFQP